MVVSIIIAKHMPGQLCAYYSPRDADPRYSVHRAEVLCAINTNSIQLFEFYLHKDVACKFIPMVWGGLFSSNDW